MASLLSDYTIRPAQTHEEAIRIWWPLMQELGWNRAKQDAVSYFRITQPQKSWLLLTHTPTSTLQGSLIPFIYSKSTGWVGFFTLNASVRGQGLGAALWREMELVFQANRTSIIGLDAVEEQVGTYSRRGFVDTAKVILMRRNNLQRKPLEVTWEYGGEGELEDIRDVDVGKIARLDLEHTGLDRSAFWKKETFLHDAAMGFAILSSNPSFPGDSPEITGFVLARRCEKGWRIGPLYAETYVQARQLLHKVMHDFRRYEDEGLEYVAEVFGSNEQGRKVFDELGWEDAGMEYHRMWKGKPPQEQMKGGKGQSGMYAIFDAGCG